MPDSIALEELKRLGRLLAEAAAEASDNPVGAISQYLRGTARAGLESVKGALKAEVPLVGRVAAQALDNAVRPGLDQRPVATGEADLTADPSNAGMLGEIIGPPMPGGGADKAAMRKIFTKIYDQTRLTQISDALSRGQTRDEIFKRLGAVEHPSTQGWVQELPGQLKIKRPWGANESRAWLGDLVDYPEYYDALRRYGIAQPERIVVNRLTGDHGYHTAGRSALGRAVPKELAIGDVSMPYIAGHELHHLLEHAQTGVPAGANADMAVTTFLANDARAQKWGLTNPKDLAAAIFVESDLTRRAELGRLQSEAWQYYLNNPGEILADLSGTRSARPEAIRRVTYPFAVANYPSTGGKVFADASASRDVYARNLGLDMTDVRKGIPNRNYSDIGAGVDSAGLDQLAERLSPARRIPRLRKEEDLQSLFEALLNSRD